MMNYHGFVISEIDLIAPSARKYGSGTIKKNSSDSSHSFLDATWSMIDKNCGEVCASRKGGFGLSTGKRVQPPPRLYFRWVESGTMIMAFVLYARFLLGHNSTISNKRDASDLILVYLQGLDLLPSLLPNEASSSLAREYICIYTSSIPDRAPLYLPVTSMTILTRVSTLRRIYPSSLTRFEPKSRAPSRPLDRPRPPWIVPNSSKGAAARCAHCARKSSNLLCIWNYAVEWLPSASEMATLHVDSSPFSLPLSLPSQPPLPPLLVYIKYNIVARFRRYRLAGSRQSTIKPRRI